MITGMRDRRRWAMLWSALISATLHVVILTLLFYALARAVITPQGAGEQVSETTPIAIQARARPKPQPIRHVHRERAPTPSRRPAHHELAKETVAAPVQPPPQRRNAAVSSMQRDQASFADEVAQLNKGNDPHAIPTIDPGSSGSPSKSYAFDAYSTSGDEHGNGIISPVRSWQDRGRDCYYARYEYTYPSGAMEDGNIPWPVCFDPSSDPFHEPPHRMPFPLPLAGYTLPPGTQLPPLEQSVYNEWAAANPSR